MKTTPFILSLILLIPLLGVGCQPDREPKIVEEAIDVAEEISEGRDEIRDARGDAARDPTLDKDPAEAAEARFRVQKEKAEAEHEVARQLCDVMKQEQQRTTCFEKASANYETAVATAERQRRESLAQARSSAPAQQDGATDKTSGEAASAKES